MLQRPPSGAAFCVLKTYEAQVHDIKVGLYALPDAIDGTTFIKAEGKDLKMRPLLSCALALMVAMPVQAADTYHARNGMKVTPAGADRFIVSGIPRNTPQSYWCAAAEYSKRFLRARFNQRMYVVGNHVRGQRQYLISLSPKGTASANGRIKQIGIRIDGANRRVDTGLSDCRFRIIRGN